MSSSDRWYTAGVGVGLVFQEAWYDFGWTTQNTNNPVDHILLYAAIVAGVVIAFNLFNRYILGIGA